MPAFFDSYNVNCKMEGIMKERTSVVRAIGILSVFLFFALMTGCATVPAGPGGQAGVKAGPVLSSNGAVKSVNPQGRTFFIKCEDQTNPPKGINLTNRLSQILVLQGKQQAQSVQDADCVIDMLVQDFETGKVGTTLGTDESRAVAIANDDAGSYILGEIIGSSYPSYIKFKVDLMLDEMPPSPVQATGKNQKVGKKTSSKSAKAAQAESIQTKTVLTESAEYRVGKSTEADAIGVSSDNISQYIANMFMVR